LASLAKRYASSTDLIRSANQDQIPEPGQFAAIPVAYTPARTPAKRAIPAKPVQKAALQRSNVQKAIVQKALAQKKPLVRKPTTVAQKASPKSAPHHTPGA
jgi:hypothetical protein